MSSSPIVVLGNFDGVHRGHRALLQAARTLAETMHGEVTVWTFDTLPDAAITPLPLRESLLLSYGADRVLYASFAAVKELSPRAFVKEILRESLGAVACVCGYNYTFGCGGSGNPATLTALCREQGILCHTVPQVTHHGEEVSSSHIRALLRVGETERANALLGHPVSLVGTVVCGNRIGRTLGFPTANLVLGADCLPKRGVYASLCHLPDGRSFPAVTNIGCRPTVTEEESITAETHLLDFAGDLYGTTVRVDLLTFLRPETKFPSVAALKAAVGEDLRRVRRTLSNR